MLELFEFGLLADRICFSAKPAVGGGKAEVRFGRGGRQFHGLL
jgi:hypothetical protein